jgi:hypothetical protein
VAYLPRTKSVANKSQTKKVAVKELTCTMCGKTKKASEFYQSFNPLHQTSKLPYCKKCIQSMSINTDGSLNIEGFKQALKMVDRPFLYDIVRSSAEDNMETIGCYFKNLGMPQYRYLGWKDSIFEPVLEVNVENKNVTSKINNFVLTDEIIDKWGDGYKDEEYQAFEKKYNRLKNNYSEKTSMHTEALFKYIRYSCKEEMATAKGDVKEAKEWGALAKDAATAAKINPSQLSKADLSDGLSTFSELSQAVEKEVDIIPILPKFKYRPNDALDFNIWCYVNYVRDIKGLPPCEYSDVYAFYDKRKSDYIKQYGDPYGIFTDDTTEKNRENIINFIKEDGE